ncbi:MAG: DUF488 family protein [Sphingomonadales bacterium]|nr:DUF488 family protein [Sphingomonadales bacterium]MDE2567706.1 DUF488 family protein [Sphingomonadales bacterium]
MGTLAVKRAYAPPDERDGRRILVDRLWPRGLGRANAAIDDWMKDIAPTPGLRKWFDHDPARFAQFASRYRRELDANPEPVTRLCALLQDGDVTLVYAARDERINHARVLAGYLAGRGCALKMEG